MAEHPVPDQSAFFPEVCEQLKTKMRREQYDTWFRGFKLERFRPEERLVEFKLPTTFVRDWIQRNFLQLLQDSVTAAGLAEAKVILTVGGGESARSSADGTGDRGPGGGDSRGMHDPQNRTHSGSLEQNAHGPNGVQSGGGLTNASGHNTNGSDAVRDRNINEGLNASAGHDGAGHGNSGHSNSGHGSLGQNGAATNGAARNRQRDSPPLGVPSIPAHSRGQSGKPRSQALNRNYTFEHFVVGTSNRLAHAASLAIGENPGCSYNPLFIHGNVGLGKTHLLQALCHSIRRRNPSARVVYLTSEEFTNEFIEAIRQGALESFRAYHREADVLVVDDIQFLASKGKTQEEFFHTFNSLYQHQKQIVLSSDRSPQDIPTLEERLVSRFKWGLVTEIEVPDFETRVAIVQRKARLRGQENGIPDDVAYMIAERIANNIRELEGAVIKVLGTGSILGREVTVELAEEALRGVAKARNQHVNMDRIMEVVTAQFPVSVRDIIGKGRTQAISYPRQIAMFLGRKHTDHSLEEIGKYFGNRDHTTVLYSVNKIAERTDTDRMLKELLDTLSGRLQR